MQETTNPTINNEFDKGMKDLFSKYPSNNKELNPKSDSLNYSDFYQLSKRIYIPSLDSLTLDFRSFLACSGCWNYKVVHVYKDTLSFILPFTDEELYWQTSGENQQLDISKEENFNIELNKLIQYFSLSNDQTLKFIDEVLRENWFWKVDVIDLPKLNFFSKDISKNHYYNDSCRLNLAKNLKTIEHALRNKEITIYSNGVLTYFVRFSKNNEVILDVLNTQCCARMMY